MSEFPATDLYDRALYLGVPPNEFVLAGSSAIEIAVGPEYRRAQDVDIAVRADTYRQLRERPDLEEEVMPDGHRRLTGDGYDISVGWGGKSVDEVQVRGYQHNGVYIAGLPDVYAYKQERGLPKDERDLQLIRDRLYGDRPMPTAMLQREMGFLKDFMPERLHARPELTVAANGLLIVRTVFGHVKEGVRTYRGSYEDREVPATYHEWEHSALGTRDGQRSMELEDEERARRGFPPQYSDDDRLAHAAGFSNHDAILGDGRRADNPTAHDEKQSAELVARHLAAVGASEYVQEGAYATTIATTFSEIKKAQDIDPARGYVHLQEKGGGSDMSSFRRPGFAPGIALSVEDLARKGAAFDQPLVRLVDHINANLPAGAKPLRIRRVEDGLRLIDEYPDFPVTKMTPDGPQQMTLKQAFVAHLRASQEFRSKYQFPRGWAIGTPEEQAAAAAELHILINQIERGEVSAVGSYAAQFRQDDKETVIRDPAMSAEGIVMTSGVHTGVEGLRAVIQETVHLLPVGEVEATLPKLERVRDMLAAAIEGASNEHTSSAAEAIAAAYELMEQVQGALAVATERLQQYNRDLG